MCYFFHSVGEVSPADLLLAVLRDSQDTFWQGLLCLGAKVKLRVFPGCIYCYCLELCARMGHNLSNQVQVLTGL